ncbi:MAG: 2-oxo acid dehydrogenase subunit E2 [Anaerolineales bacterium]|jgi:2-oxoglutarate dehydrogenase E2 component (dihydrolipoamide succinyltransferase)|nr:2-oxo acid dehydrogenase subunit E2 [Anaerolineales bacterium]
MPTQVLMPQLGESVDEGTVTKWLKAVGDRVEEYEPLLEVNTDKVDTEVPSPAAGILLEILVEPETTVKAGTLLAIIGAAGEGGPLRASTAAASPPPLKVEPPAPPSPAAPPAPSGRRDRVLGFISPIVAKLASEHQVDLSRVQGTGEGGRITKQDVLAFVQSAAATPQPAPAPATAPILPASPTGDEILPLTSLRRSIAEHMVHSKHTSPHVTTVMEVDMSAVAAHRAANKELFARDGVNLTFTAYFIAATSIALKAFPIVNSSWSEAGIVLHRQVNIGMATSLGEAGLIVPVIKNADSLSLLGLARTINDLAARARARKLAPDEVKGGTFTITNHGTGGSLFAQPIINQPQCGILGVGTIQKRVVVLNDKALGDVIAIRPMVYLSFTFDHRILDGAAADDWLGKVVQTLKNWS